MRMVAAVLGVVTLGLTACGGDGDDDDEPVVSTTPGTDPDQRYTARATVLESPDHGPQLCLGGVALSLPPQCGGPDITNWSWDDVGGGRSLSGTTWGEYMVVGTYDGADFTLTELPTAPPADPTVEPTKPDRTTPCDEPSGGWAVVDESKATSDAMERAIRAAESEPDHAATWLDQSINPALSDDLSDDELEGRLNDPTKLILNFRFTGDIERHEREIRAIWGGPLCVTKAEHTMAELMAIREELANEYDGVLASGPDGRAGVVEIEVVLDDGSMQQAVDERYGAGVVSVRSALQPVD